MHPPAIRLAVAIGLCASWLGASAPAHAEKGWKLEQAGDYLGPMTVFVGKKSIRVILQRYGINFCLSSADFKVIGYNERTKSYFSEDYDTWKDRFLRSRGDYDRDPAVQQGLSTIADLKVKRFLVQSLHGGQAARAPTANGRSYNTEMFVTDDIKTPTEFVSLMTSITYLPSNLGFPIRVVRYSPMGAKTVAWNTLKTQRLEVPEKYSVPKGYSPVDTELALFVGSTSEDQLGGNMMAMGQAIGVMHHSSGRDGGRAAISQRWAPGMGDDQPAEGFKATAADNPLLPTSKSGEWAPGF